MSLSKSKNRKLLQLSTIFTFCIIIIIIIILEVLSFIALFFYIHKPIVNTSYFRIQWSNQNFEVSLTLRIGSFWCDLCFRRFVLIFSINRDFIFCHGCELFLVILADGHVLLIDVVIDGVLMFLDGIFDALDFIFEFVIYFTELFTQSC